MLANRSMPSSAVIPVLAYADVGEAVTGSATLRLHRALAGR